jgi:hypothetical protein
MSEEDESSDKVTFFEVVEEAASVVKRLGPKLTSCKTILEEMKNCLQTAFDINTQAIESARAIAEGNESEIKETATEAKKRLYDANNKFLNAYNKFRSTSKQPPTTDDATLEGGGKEKKNIAVEKKKETTVHAARGKGAKKTEKRKVDESPERSTGASATMAIKIKNKKSCGGATIPVRRNTKNDGQQRRE